MACLCRWNSVYIHVCLDAYNVEHIGHSFWWQQQQQQHQRQAAKSSWMCEFTNAYNFPCKMCVTSHFLKFLRYHHNKHVSFAYILWECARLIEISRILFHGSSWLLHFLDHSTFYVKMFLSTIGRLHAHASPVLFTGLDFSIVSTIRKKKEVECGLAWLKTKPPFVRISHTAMLLCDWWLEGFCCIFARSRNFRPFDFLQSSRRDKRSALAGCPISGPHV